MIHKVKRWTLAGSLALTVFALSACAGNSEANSNLTPVRIAVGLDPTYALVFVAQDQGYFEKYGVEANLVQTEGGPSMIQSVSAGQADFCYGTDLTSVSYMGTNADLASLGVIGQSDTNFFTVFGKGITDASQIKSMAVVPGSAAYMTDKFLKSEGIDPSSVKMVQAAFPDIPAIMSRGDADATVAIQPWADRVVSDAGGKIMGDIGDFGAYYALYLTTSRKWLDSHEEAAAGVFKALRDASAYVAANPEKAAALTEENLKIPPEQAIAVFKSTDFTSRDFNDADAEQVQAATDFFISQGSIKAGPEESQILKGWFTTNVAD